MILGVDFSQYGGVPSQSTIACWKAQGARFAIVQYSSIARAQLAALAVGGLVADLYCYLFWDVDPWGQTPQQRTANALALAQTYHLETLWLDAEDTTHPYREDQLIECDALVEASGLEPGIYTAPWFWRTYAHNSERFKHRRLWDAHYLGEAPAPDLGRLPADFSYFQPYGGWQAPSVMQWWNTTTFCSHSVDLNAMLEPAEIEETMSNPVWAHLRNPPAGVPFRSYLLYATPTGLKSRHVASSEEHEAVRLSRVAGNLVTKDLATLRAFHCDPDPEAP